MSDAKNATTAILLAASLAVSGVSPAAETATPTGRPLVPLLNAAAITARCEGELATLRRDLKAMEARKGGSVFAELNALSFRANDFASPVYLLQKRLRPTRPRATPPRRALKNWCRSIPSSTRAPRSTSG